MKCGCGCGCGGGGGGDGRKLPKYHEIRKKNWVF